MSIKFEFTTEFQFEILKYTVQDNNGIKVIELYDDSYFTIVSHSVIAYTLKKYYKRKKNIPGQVILIEEIHNTFNHRDFINSLTNEDREEILELVKEMFKGVIKDGDELLIKTERFAQYVDLKNEIENIDLLNYEAYESFSRKVQKAISPRIQILEDRGSFLIRDAKYRQLQRKDTSPIVPFPYKNLNWLTNAGGYIRHSIFVVLDAAKKWKTGMLVNLSLGYLKHHNVFVADLDNGKGEFMMRVEQASVGLTKPQLLSGDFDEKIKKNLRKRKRQMKTELFVKEYPALITTANDIENDIEMLYREYGIKVGILMIDYIQKMGCISGKESLHERISDAYIDVGNIAKRQDLAHVWTAQHVNKEGQKFRMKTRYESTDVAGSLDVSRHAQAIFGLNRTPEEEEAGYQRMEVVEQRDGKKGRAIFKVDRKKQIVKELNKIELKEYYDEFGNLSKEDNENNGTSYIEAKKAQREKKRNTLKKDLDAE